MPRNKTSILFRGFLGLLLASALVALAPPAACQEEPMEEEEEFDPRVYLNTEEDADGLLRAAWRARENNNWRMAIEKYLETIREYGGTVFAANERLYLPMRALVRKELSELPKEGKEIYKLLKGREAELAYRRALRSGKLGQLRRIAEEYPCLPTAPRALYHLGEWSRARGEAGRAVFFWQQLMAEYPDWEGASRAAVLTRAALVSAEAGRTAEGWRFFDRLKKVGGLAKLRVGSKESIVADAVKKRLEAAGPAGGGARLEAGFWPTMGGSPAHDGQAARMVDAGVRRWQRKLGGTVRPTNPRYSHIRQPKTTSTGPVVPKRHGVCAGGMVYVAGDDSIVAVRAMSGKTIWAASKGRVDEKLPSSRMALPAIGGDRIFVVMGAPPRGNRYSHFRRPQTTYSSSIKLRAYALSGGKLRWESGRFESDKTKEFLKGVDLVSMPVHDSGYVYVPAVKRSATTNDTYMLCFDANDGRMVWQTFVCAGYPMKVGYYHNQTQVQEDTLPPAVKEGLIAFCTNVGAVSVLDATSGQLLWVYLYDRLEPPKTDRFGRPTATGVDSWAPSAPIIKDGLVICAPQDSPELLALELATGKVRWKSRRGSLKHLVGVSGETLVASGGKDVVGFSLRSGKRRWRGRLEDQEAGLGVLSNDSVMIPTLRGLQRFSLKTGKLLAKFRFKDGKTEAGNLLVSGDVLVSVGDKAYGGYYAWKEIVAKLDKQIAASPKASKPRAELGEVYFSAEKYAQASKIFKAALSRAKPGETSGGIALVPVIKRQIWESHSRLGDADEKAGKADAALAQYREAHKYRVDEGTSMIGHMRFARCKEKLGQHAPAVAELMTVLGKYAKETYKVGSRRTMAGNFAKTEIDRLIKAKGRSVYEVFDRKANQLLAAAGTVATVRRVIEAYPNSAAVSPALIKLSEIHTRAGKHAEAAAALREHLYKRRGSARDLEVRARLALAYEKQGINGLARSVLRQMQRRNIKDSFKLGSKAWTVKDFVGKHMPDVKGPGKGLPAPKLTPPLASAWKVTPGGNVQVAPNAGEHEVTGAAFLIVNQREIMAVDLSSGQQLWRKAGPAAAAVGGRFIRSRLNAVATSGAVLTANGNRLRALSPATGESLWDVELFKVPAGVNSYSIYPRLAAGDGVVAAVASWNQRDPKTRRYTYKAKIVMLDEGTGRQVWSKDFGGNVQQVKLVDGTLIVAGYDYRTRKGSMAAYEIADGSKRFGASFTGSVQQIATSGGLAAIASQKGIHCYDLGTGKLKWKASAGGRYQRILASDDSKLVVLGQNYGRSASAVCAFDFETGKRLWKGPSVAGLRYSTNMRSGSDYLMLSAYNYKKKRHTVIGLDAKNGKKTWSSELPQNSYIHSTLVGQLHGGAIARIRKGGGYVYERRIWNMKTGKLVEKKSCGGYGFLRVHEGAILQLTGGTAECLVPAGTKRTPKKK
jgi:outer membrane protein assembly factor BamB